MATAACGINCDVCRLNVMGICSTCGSGISPEAEQKSEAQIRILGQPCPILECARINRHPYCLRDCPSFPCENFQIGPYPFSQGFLQMQERRRQQKPTPVTPQGDVFKIPSEYWDELKTVDIDELCQRSLAQPHPPEGVTIQFLHQHLMADIQHRTVTEFKNGLWEPINHPLKELLVLVYLRHVTDDRLDNEMITHRDLKDAQFFQGPHELKTAPLLERYGMDIAGFRRAAVFLGGIPLKLSDAAYKLSPFPKIPLYYLFWEGDEEFKPRMSILFDRSIERHLSADAIWGLVNLVSDMLLFLG